MAEAARILIADDNPQGLELIDAYLATGPYQIETAADGEETLRKAKSFNPDVILLDVMMPKISGFEVCKRIKTDPTLQNTSILMITALDQSSDVDRAVAAGTDDFMTKPINQAELLGRIEAMLASRKEKSEFDRAIAYMSAVQHQ